MTKDEVKQVQVELLEKLFDAKLATVNEAMRGINREVASINKAINGNGQPGLIQRMETAEKNIAGIYLRFGFLVTIGSIVGTFFISLVPTIFSAIAAHFK